MQPSQDLPYVLFTGGGTGGHVFPGLAVLDRLCQIKNIRVGWLGGSRGMERDIVSRHRILQSGDSVRYYGVPTGKLRRYFSFRNFVDLFRIFGGLVASLVIMIRDRPAVLFSKGGFVSVPPVVAARILGVPVITHESDADPGLATRINARFAHRILVAYETTKQHFPGTMQSRVTTTGNPIRQDVLVGSSDKGLQIAGFRESDPRPVVFFLGGSQGASQINRLVEELAPKIATTWRVIHQTGEEPEGSSAAAIAGNAQSASPGDRESWATPETCFRRPFFREELPDLLAAADLLVCRAGASTLWEGAVLGKPLLLVPLVSGSRGDQVRNSRIFQEAGGALVFLDPAVMVAEMHRELVRLAVDPSARETMGRNALSLVHNGGTQMIADMLVELIDQETQDNNP